MARILVVPSRHGGLVSTNYDARRQAQPQLDKQAMAESAASNGQNMSMGICRVPRQPGRINQAGLRKTKMPHLR